VRPLVLFNLCVVRLPETPRTAPSTSRGQGPRPGEPAVAGGAGGSGDWI